MPFCELHLGLHVSGEELHYECKDWVIRRWKYSEKIRKCDIDLKFYGYAELRFEKNVIPQTQTKDAGGCSPGNARNKNFNIKDQTSHKLFYIPQLLDPIKKHF